METNLPAEYKAAIETKVTGYYRSYYPIANDIVTNRIKEVLAAKKLDKRAREIANHNFRVMMVRIGYGSNYMTRVYVGGYGKKEMLCSKMNQSIDIDKVVATIVANAQKEVKQDDAEEVRREVHRQSDTEAKKIRKEFGLQEYGKLTAEGTDLGVDEVEVHFEQTLTTKQARAVIAAIKEALK